MRLRRAQWRIDSPGDFTTKRLTITKVHALAYAWEGTPAFEERVRTLSPEQYLSIGFQI